MVVCDPLAQVYGLALGDVFVWLPNVCGLLLVYLFFKKI